MKTFDKDLAQALAASDKGSYFEQEKLLALEAEQHEKEAGEVSASRSKIADADALISESMACLMSSGFGGARVEMSALTSEFYLFYLFIFIFYLLRFPKQQTFTTKKIRYIRKINNNNNIFFLIITLINIFHTNWYIQGKRK